MTHQHYPFPTEGKRYYTWSKYLKEQFGCKVFKVALDAGFDCPNRDGTVAYGGCTFCSVAGSGDFAGNRVDPIDIQFQKIKQKMHQKWKNGKPMAYFQAYTNTHAPLSVLKEKFEVALAQDDVVGLSIATRPDCLPDDVVEYLAELNQRTHLWIELGLQTIHEQTAKLVNRAHDFHTFSHGVDKLRKHDIRVCTHIMNGLPGESYEMMMDTAKQVATLDVQAIKIHLLHLLKGTPMVKQYEKGLLEFLEQDTYIQLVADQLEVLPPHMIIQRITGDGPIDQMIGPMWSVSKWDVLNGIDQTLKNRNSWQGKYYSKERIIHE